MCAATVSEGYISVPGGRVWYGIVGTGPGVPLLALHGGPGVPHNYLQPLEGLGDERPVIFYDQLGCGRSDRPDDVSLWRLERFVTELSELRQALQLERVHLFGHSWGTILATEHALAKPSGLLSLILASVSMSHARMVEDVLRLCADYPAQIYAALRRQLSGDCTQEDETLLAPVYEEYSQRHMYRTGLLPDCLLQSIAGIGQQVYTSMRGGSGGFCLGGELLSYDSTSRLGEIAVPTLLTCGRYDDSTPETTAWYRDLIPGSEMAVFEQGSHMHMLEEGEHYLEVVRSFLRRAEQ